MNIRPAELMAVGASSPLTSNWLPKERRASPAQMPGSYIEGVSINWRGEGLLKGVYGSFKGVVGVDRRQL